MDGRRALAAVMRVARGDGFWVCLLLAAFAAVVFVTQNRIVGLEPGYNELQPGHHGWVFSHTLAIAAHATAETGFVGYAYATIDEDGRRDYVYFDRYPVFFSVALHAALSLRSRLSTQIYLAKQVMNVVFVLTVFAAFLLARRLGGKTLPAVVAALLAVCSRYLLFYKDMAHFDQPALLGGLVLLYAIAVHEIGGPRWPAYAATVVAVSLGCGYAVVVVLLLWWASRVVAEVRAGNSSAAAALGGIQRLLATRCLLLGVGWAALNLAYNIALESHVRGVPVVQTSIVGSAVERLGMNQELNASYEDILDWRFFAAEQLLRLLRWSLPVWEYQAPVPVNMVVLAVMISAIILFGRSLGAGERRVLWVLASWGPVWLFGMRSLSAFHDYTSMYCLGTGLAFYLSLVSLVRLPRPAWLLTSVFALLLFTHNHLATQSLHVRLGAPYNVYTYDFMRIAAALPQEGSRIWLADGVGAKAPYAQGFYLPGHLFAPPGQADYIITKDRGYRPDNLAPENERLFLFALEE